MSIETRVKFIRNALSVRRFHQNSTNEIDTVGKHSCGVALYVNLINPNARKEVIVAALLHDLGEFVLGDIPSPSKKALSQQCRDEFEAVEARAMYENGIEFPELTSEEEYLLKFCDCLDGLSFCIEERIRGNRFLDRAGDNYLRYLGEQLSSIPYDSWSAVAVDVFSVLERSWRKYE